jgi:hypothetical protein
MIDLLSVTRSVKDSNGLIDEVKTAQLKTEREGLVKTLLGAKELTGHLSFLELANANFKGLKEPLWRFFANIAKHADEMHVGNRLKSVQRFAARKANDAIPLYDNSVPRERLLLTTEERRGDTAQMRHEATSVFDLT